MNIDFCQNDLNVHVDLNIAFWWQVIFQVALTILDNNSSELLSCKDDGEAMPVLSGYLENVTSRDTSMPNTDRTRMLCTQDKPAQVGNSKAHGKLN